MFVDNEYFSIITTCKGYQVIRFFFVRSRQKVGQKAEYSIFEVAQRWIAPDGKSETVARLRGFSLLYYDLWNEDSPMEIRRNNQHKVYDIDPICTYPRRRIIPEIKRNGFDGNLHGILPYDFFKAILSDSRAETLLKSGNIEHLRYFLSRPQVLDRCWNSYKIAMRNKYAITDISLWCDLVYLLERLGKDLRTPVSYARPISRRLTTCIWGNGKSNWSVNGSSNTGSGKPSGWSVSGSVWKKWRKRKTSISERKPHSSTLY